jgi:hypothetical protein
MAIVNCGELWGFIDRDGVVSVPLTFSDAREFSEGLAAVKKNGKWGFINTSGRFSIAPTFDFVHSSFEGGLSYVRRGSLQGYIDRNGRWIWTRSD